MSKAKHHLCCQCGCEDELVRRLSGMWIHPLRPDCVRALQRRQGILRDLLAVAVDAWEVCATPGEEWKSKAAAWLDDDAWHEAVRKEIPF